MMAIGDDHDDNDDDEEGIAGGAGDDNAGGSESPFSGTFAEGAFRKVFSKRCFRRLSLSRKPP
jgi:hypothetical protein